MFPTSNDENPNFDHHKETLLEPPFPYDQNPSSTLEDHHPFLYFPSPFLDDHDLPLTQIFSQHQQPHQHEQLILQDTHGKEPDTPKPRSQVTTKKKRSLSSNPRKRIGKKDRHSKIRTAQGVRDRRMRLSVHIARKFFDLQDMLGFDKASKTIEWLFSNSKNAIKELSIKHHRANATSSSVELCEMVAAMEDDGSRMKEKSTECNLQARESREKARARARERTKEKMMIKQFYEPNSNPNPNTSFERLGFSNPNNHFLEEESNSYIENIIHQEKNSTHIEASNNSIASIFECYQNIHAGISIDTDSNNSFMGNLLGNWELLDSNDASRIIISPFSSEIKRIEDTNYATENE